MAIVRLTKREARKLKRRQEVDAFASEARFWIGKNKSADRSPSHTQPVNRQAAKDLKGKRP